MALKTIGTLSGAAHVSPPAVAASNGRTGHGRRALIDDTFAKPLYAAGNTPAAR